MIDEIEIGNVKIKKTAALAPMAGVADKAFRIMAKQFGASYVVSEMVSAKAVCYRDKKTEKLLAITDAERPIAIQLFGEDEEYLAKAAYIVLKYKPDIIDINMGCPAKKIISNNSGAALMKRPDIIAKIVKAVVKAVDVPVTVKIRSGWDKNTINAVEVAKIIEANGASAVTVHGRTKEQMYLFNSSLDVIKRVKEAVKIPVIGNGDVVDLPSAINMYRQTNCDLVMIGRGALGNPWVFKEISAYYKNGEVVEKPSINQRVLVMLNHVKFMVKYSGEQVAIKEARKHIAWYLKGFKNAAIIRNKISTINTMEDLYAILNEYIDGGVEYKL